METLTYGSETPPMSMGGSSMAWMTVTARVWELKSYSSLYWSLPR